MLVGSINIVEEHINGTHPVDLAAVGSVDMSVYGGPVLSGYAKGDVIELRYYSNGMEYKVDADLSDSQYGNAMEMSVGTINVLDIMRLINDIIAEVTTDCSNCILYVLFRS